MGEKTKLLVGALGAVAVLAVAAGVGVAAGGDDRPLRGNDYDRATAAAMEHVGKGTVTETEAGDDGAAYEVEIRLQDGREVEVQLDDNFDVVGSEGDDDASKDGEGGDED